MWIFSVREQFLILTTHENHLKPCRKMRILECHCQSLTSLVVDQRPDIGDSRMFQGEKYCSQTLWILSPLRRRQWQPTPVLLPGKSHGWRSLVGCTPRGLEELDMTGWLHFHALEKDMVTHSSVLAWRIPGTGEPGGLPSVGSHRVGDDWSDLAAAAAVHWDAPWKLTSQSAITRSEAEIPCTHERHTWWFQSPNSKQGTSFPETNQACSLLTHNWWELHGPSVLWWSHPR